MLPMYRAQAALPAEAFGQEPGTCLSTTSPLRRLHAPSLLGPSHYGPRPHLHPPPTPRPTPRPPPQFTFMDIANLFGIVCGYISTFLAWSYTRAGRKLGMLQVGAAMRKPGGPARRYAMQAWTPWARPAPSLAEAQAGHDTREAAAGCAACAAASTLASVVSTSIINNRFSNHAAVAPSLLPCRRSSCPPSPAPSLPTPTSTCWAWARPSSRCRHVASLPLGPLTA